MSTMMRWLAVPMLAMAIVPFLADLHLPFGDSGLGIAYARNGGGGGGAGAGGGGAGGGAGGPGGGEGIIRDR